MEWVKFFAQVGVCLMFGWWLASTERNLKRIADALEKETTIIKVEKQL